MNRAFLAAAAGILCAAAGLRQSLQLQRDAATLGRWCSLLQHLALMMRSGMALPDAFDACADQQGEPDRILRELAQALRVTPLLPLHRHAEQMLPAGISRNALLRMFSALGHGPLDMRLQAVSQAQEELLLLHKDAEKRAEKDAKLYRTLGLTAGVCLTLLLL